MKPQHLVCYTALLARVFPVLYSKKDLLSSHRQCHRTGFCPSLWFAAGYKALFINQGSARERKAERKTQLSSMSHPGSGYSQHNVQVLKDLGSDHFGPMDVIVAGQRHDAKEHVIFFGGDVQVV